MKEETPKKNRKRLSVEVPIEIHNQLKYISIFRNCTIRKLVLRALIAFIKHEEKFI